MSILTSSKFASTVATGTDWRDISKKVLESIESVKTDSMQFSLGFLYVTDHLADDLTSVVNLFKSVTNIDHWVGCVGLGVIGNHETHFDRPAMSAMVCNINPDQFRLFNYNDLANHEEHNDILSWKERNDPRVVVVHGDPMADIDPFISVMGIEKMLDGFVVGGLSSARQQNFQISGEVQQNNVSGVVFNENVNIITAISQGCVPIGDTYTVTKSDDTKILELDHKNAFDVFTEDLKKLAVEKIGKDAQAIISETKDINNPDDLPDDLKNLFSGEVHMAFSIVGSDTKDFMVRNIIGIDPEEGSIVVPQIVQDGDQVLFVRRDSHTVESDLCKTLLNLNNRAQKELDQMKPKGAVYISCVARSETMSLDVMPSDAKSEAAYIQDILGDIPLVGFYASGEISNANLYGYTGVVILFL